MSERVSKKRESGIMEKKLSRVPFYASSSVYIRRISHKSREMISTGIDMYRYEHCEVEIELIDSIEMKACKRKLP